MAKENGKITEEELLEELREAIRDCFVGTTTKESDGLVLSLFGGQKFCISVKELA